MRIFGFVKKVLFTGLTILSSLACVNSLKCISMSNQPCEARPEIVNVNSDNPIFYPFSIKTSKCSGNCNNINDPYAKICVLDIETAETAEEVKPAIITLSKNKNIYKCSSSVVYTILIWIFFAINIDGIGTYLVYFYWYLNKYSPYVGFNTCKSTAIY